MMSQYAHLMHMKQSTTHVAYDEQCTSKICTYYLQGAYRDRDRVNSYQRVKYNRYIARKNHWEDPIFKGKKVGGDFIVL
ncbi:hypothetical protein RhiirC2_741275 [Rhizophagus irregularis]|uniref:Uncharacterized protein n=1 Tax=Rhizophagus irregularis TaxID=588596 RepID=A0A2N1NH68_9GLOM|nr:hypothetical protein RhiirC2_741275 [Rhizophagus irregularis]